MESVSLYSVNDRPVLPRIDTAAPIQAVRDDLDRLGHEVERTLSCAEELLRMQRSQADGQRDALHLLARIEAVLTQIEEAKLPLRRMTRRSVEYRRVDPKPSSNA